MPQQDITQRAYTLRLRGKDPQDASWRDALWHTHEAVNKGARIFGDWLLTLRGGLDHKLADTKVEAKGKKPAREPTNEERKTRRIFLALSWLSVESRLGAPDDFIIASGENAAEERNCKVVEALVEILKSRGVASGECIDEWKDDCSTSLCAAIRDDATWVNRSKAFDKKIKDLLTRDKIWDMLERFFESPASYFAPIQDPSDNSSNEGKKKDLVKEAGKWLSNRFGAGKGADFLALEKSYKEIAEWVEQVQPGMTGEETIAVLAGALNCQSTNGEKNNLERVLARIISRGPESKTRNYLKELNAKTTVTQEHLDNLRKEAALNAKKCEGEIGLKGPRPYSNAIMKEVERVCGFDYQRKGEPARHSEFTVMLDHAARRVSMAHTWIKRAEAERRRFEEDTQKMANVPGPAKDWLDSFCQERSGVSGALEPYRIRRRAIGRWEKIVAAWNEPLCKTCADRIAAARALQDDDLQDEKFGDIQLFEALAEDSASCVWHTDDDTRKPTKDSLLDYVFATEAEFKQQRFKVPAYRHPCAFLHPIFCDFGKSRWGIDFSIHKATKGLKKLRKEVEERQEDVRKAETDKGKIREKESGEAKRKKLKKACKGLEEARKKVEDAEREVACPSNLRQLKITLWKGKIFAIEPLWWQSKKLAQDLAIVQDTSNDEATEISRADRLGRTAANVPQDGVVKISHLFEQEHWNGRLQAPRRQLEALATQFKKHGWAGKAKKMRDRLQWLVTFSAKLQLQGPWCEFATCHQLKIYPQYWPYVEENKKRKGHARLILSRLPGLRILSVDLGHRHAASCAVWEALSAEQVKEACQSHNHEEPRENDLYLHLKKKAGEQRKGKEVEVEKTSIYRRIGADTLPEGTPHPAPWARLDRQFIIKLQGEETNPRKASLKEVKAVEDFEQAVGRPAPENRSLGVADLMRETVRTARLFIRDHGYLARIAYSLTTEKKLLPGGKEEELTEDKRVEMLQDFLVTWHILAHKKRPLKEIWDRHISTLTGYEHPETITEDIFWKDRKNIQNNNRDKLRGAAETLSRNQPLRMKLHCRIATLWREDDKLWKQRLRWLRDWILPRGAKAKDPAIRQTGGLSLGRITTVKSLLYQVQKAFFMRPDPEDLKKNIPAKGQDDLRGFGQGILDTMEHLREQRTKQLASRIAEAALGIGRMKRPRPMGNQDPKRPGERVDQTCHAVIIENLTHYRPEETRARKENRQLMAWASGKVKKYLAEACQLNGLHLREVQANYTSRQDSRTGAPGVRCQDVSVLNFMTKRWWRKEVKKAQEKREKNQGTARERYLVDLDDKCAAMSGEERKNAPPLRIPVKGGDLFVSARRESPAARGLQADLNAAANIGLRALIDPDWPGKWWYVPCDTKNRKPMGDKVGGSHAVDLKEALKKPGDIQDSNNKTEANKNTKKENGKTKEIVNLWCDVSGEKLAACEWREYAAYQEWVEKRVVDNLREEAKIL